jgi:phosphoenolpyruvate carboxykinase (GTP)
VETPIGRLPAPGSLDVDGLGLTDRQLELLLSVDREVWREEASLIPAHYEAFGSRMPRELWDQYEALLRRLSAPPAPKLQAANSDETLVAATA